MKLQTIAVDDEAQAGTLGVVSTTHGSNPVPSRKSVRRGSRWRRHRATLAVALGLALLAAACSSDEDEASSATFIDDGAAVVVANAPGTVTTNGPQRMLIALLGSGPNEFLGDESQPVEIEFLSPADGEPTSSRGTFLSTDGVALGLYVTSFDFDQTGQWGVRLGGDVDLGTAGFVQVVDESVVPARGQAAPRSISPTAAAATDMAEITTDPEPDPDFYDLSIDEAVTNGRPSAIVFSTPAFCQTAICGPTLEMVKEVAADHPEVDFVHVEPFDLDEARAGSLVPTDVMIEWQLPTEPWIFVVDADGVVAATFEGLIGGAELRTALDQL